MSALRPKYKNVKKRKWSDIRNAWLEHVPTFTAPGTRPDPGVDALISLQQLPLPAGKARFADIDGLRANLLWEAVFLFHKCAHAHLAAQRIGHAGMPSWCLFNAYHSAYIGARGIMAVLGVALPHLRIDGSRLLVDVFLPPESSADTRKLRLGMWRFEEFLIVRLPGLDHAGLWEGFQRVLRVSDVPCWETSLRQELLEIDYKAISRIRNHILYWAAFWPGDDLLTDTPPTDVMQLPGDHLDTEEEGFLLRLSFVVYRLFEQVLVDLGELSEAIRVELASSRVMRSPDESELSCYQAFLANVEASKESASPSETH